VVGSVAGLASMVSYPALLAVGLPPVAAKVTNMVGITFAGAGSTLGSRPELAGQRASLRTLGATAVLGGWPEPGCWWSRLPRRSPTSCRY